MKARGGSEADRLRRHNEEFRYALDRNVTILEARRQLAQLRMLELEERVHPPLTAAIDRCGTEVRANDPECSHYPPHQGRTRFWWEDDAR